MRNITRAAAAVSVVLLAGSANAQLLKGSEAPSFAIEQAWNDGPTDFSELSGKLVILDFSQTW